VRKFLGSGHNDEINTNIYNMKMRREVEVCVISDVHLGSYGCHAKELNKYISSIKPKKLILNGDIFDGYVFNKNYFPKEHIEFVRNVLRLLKGGTEVFYLVGNHDDFMRHFDEISMLNLHKLDKLVLNIDGKVCWFFHGDVFDISMRGNFGKALAKIGGRAYDWLIVVNRLLNQFLKLFGKKPYSLSKKIKDSVKTAVKFVGDFEEMSCEHAIKQGYDYVINGHIHCPKIMEYKNEDGNVIYLNSGDWVENLTSLEYNNGEWKIYRY
jgi:UDP-2,3-diacylglucosamine pyrophosphatase LpxH